MLHWTGSVIGVCLFFPQDLKPSNIVVKEDCSLKVRVYYVPVHEQIGHNALEPLPQL